jgi:hypothetical protein
MVHESFRTVLGFILLAGVYMMVCIVRTPFSSVASVGLGQTDLLTGVGRPRFFERKEEFLLSRAVNISRPFKEVTKAVLTPDLWRLCYPETIALGGVSRRPMKPGDIILEKFVFNGMWYVVFRYTVETDDISGVVRFHGIPAFTNALLQNNFQFVLDAIGGTFEYRFKDLNGRTTEWTRDLYLYTTSSNPIIRLLFWFAVSQVQESQERGASLFLECSKMMLENFKESVFAEHM